MRFQFRYRNTAQNLVGLALFTTYQSFAGVINVVFTVSMLALFVAALRREMFSWLLFPFLGMIFFPVLQPMLIYIRIKRSLSMQQEDTVISFTEKEIFVSIGEQSQCYPMSALLSMRVTPFQVALYLNRQHGFVIPRSAFSKEEYRRFIPFMRDRLHKNQEMRGKSR